MLFHSGFLGLRPGRFVRCAHYRPITFYTIVRLCPEVRIVCSHMRNPWWEEALLAL